MREFIITDTKSDQAVLVGLITRSQSEEQAQEYLDELDFLSRTAGVSPVVRFVQRLEQAHPVTFVGKGKLEEIRQYVEENEIGLVIFADEPSGALDQATGHEMMQLLTAAVSMAGATLVVVTHDVNVARWCSRLIEIRDGLVHSDRLLNIDTANRSAQAARMETIR